jgi:hypothetical protein
LSPWDQLFFEGCRKRFESGEHDAIISALRHCRFLRLAQKEWPDWLVQHASKREKQKSLRPQKRQTWITKPGETMNPETAEMLPRVFAEVNRVMFEGRKLKGPYTRYKGQIFKTLDVYIEGRKPWGADRKVFEIAGAALNPPINDAKWVEDLYNETLAILRRAYEC